MDSALVYADPSKTRVRRDDTFAHALIQLPHAGVVKIAKELVEEFDKLPDRLKNGGLAWSQQWVLCRKQSPFVCTRTVHKSTLTFFLYSMQTELT